MADKKISQLDSVPSISSGSEFPFSKSGLTYKGTVDQIGDYIGKTKTYSELQTADKTFVGAINEAAQSGSIEMEKTVTTPVAVAVFNDGGDNIPVKSLIVNITGTNTGEGEVSPDNPYTITAFDTVIIKNDVSSVTQKTYTIQLGETVYEGTLNVLSGELTINKAIDVYDGSVDEDWILQSINQYNIANFTIGRTPNPYIESNRFEEQSSSISQTTTEGFYASTNFYFRINKSRAETVSDFRTWLSNNNVVMVYELQTPIVINLTPIEVRTLLGENNIYANCGDIDTLIYFNNNARETTDVVEAFFGEVVNLYATLTAGSTSVTISNSAIKTNSTIDVYTDAFGIDPTNIVVTDGQIVLSFNAQLSDIGVKVRVS